MQMKLKLPVKKGDTVEVISGAHRGKKGEVLELMRDLRRGTPQIKVRGVRVQVHFDKKEGIQKKEGFIDYSNVRLAKNIPANKVTSKSSASASASTSSDSSDSKEAKV